MSKTLVIVESPAKAKTIEKILGADYQVLASYGHVRDLPESAAEIPEEFKKKKWAQLGVNVEEEFQPIYIVPGDKRARVKQLVDAAKSAERILLATDEDREGESISWHILQVLKPKKSVEVKRIVFHEVTPEAIKDAVRSPRDLDVALVKAQETRRILDRLYGYTLSPLLWRKIARGLSAGRVQSVAVRIVVMRERERRDFVSITYSGVAATLAAKDTHLETKLISLGGQSLVDGGDFNAQGQQTEAKKLWLKADQAAPLAETLKSSAPWTVTKYDTKPGQENPPVPFMTSTLQQEANRKLGLTTKDTMRIAQALYEGIDIGGERVGLITYMRTDSLTLADRALKQAKEVITEKYGKEYALEKPRTFANKSKNAQEAHEAIRPTDLSRTPGDVKNFLTGEQFRLYDLIWKRTIACQMAAAKVNRTRVEITVDAKGQPAIFTTSGKEIGFPGFLRAYVEGSDDPDAELGDKERLLPKLTVGDILKCENVTATTHSTNPPARYTEASLIERLEQEGIGRPSTYQSIIGTVIDRGYIRRNKKELVPTWTAMAVVGLLEDHFGRLVDLRFTALLETELDEVADGQLDPIARLRSFYTGTDAEPGIEREVTEKAKTIPFPNIPVADDIIVRLGRNGPFLQRGEGGTGNLADLPEDLAPADLTEEKIAELFERRKSSGAAIGVDANTGMEVFKKVGRFGPYLERAPLAEGEDPKRLTLPPDVDESSLTDEDLALLFTFPRLIGIHPESNEEVQVLLGRYGAYLSAGVKKANIGDWRKGAEIELEEALKLLAEPPKRGAATRSAPEPLRVLGTAEGLEGEIKVMSGRYGPYVTNGTTNATLPKSLAPETVTLEEAANLIKEKAAAGPAPKKRFTKKPAAKSTRKKK